MLAHLQRFEGAASDMEVLRQGAETSSFWEAIGGDGVVSEVGAYKEYMQEQVKDAELEPLPKEHAAFYHLLDSGWDRYETFDEDDLEIDGIFVLYVPHHVWVWIGSEYKSKGGREVDGLTVARKFMDDLGLPQEGDITIIKHVEQESDEFLSHFH